MALTGVRSKLHKLVVGFFGSLARYSVRQPWRVLLIAALLTLTAAPGLRWLKLRTDGHALVSPVAPEVIYDRTIRNQFGIRDNIVVLVRSGHADGIFNAGTVQLIRELSAEFGRLPGIGSNNVISLATEPNFRFRPGTFTNQRFLEPALTNKVALDQLRDDIRRIELYTGTLVSTNGQFTTILIGAPDGADRTRLLGKVMDIVAARQNGQDKISVSGAPVAESLLGAHILEDLGVPKAWLGISTRTAQAQEVWRLPHSFYELRRLIARSIGLVPVAVLIMMLVFYASFRNWLATLLPLPEVAATLLFVFGLMGWLGVPVYLTIAVMPVLLTAMCVTDEIHVFSRYVALLRENPGVNHVKLVGDTMDEMVCPVVNTTLTTAAGFISFAFSPLQPVQAFGVFTGIGILFSLLLSLTVIPAMLTLINPDRLVSRRHCDAHGYTNFLAGWFARLGHSVVRRRCWIVVGLVTVGMLAPFSLRRLVVQDSWIDGFSPDSEFRQTTQQINDHFHGMHMLLVSCDAAKLLVGEVASSNVNPRIITLPGNIVDDPVLIMGGSIRFTLFYESAEGASWQSSIETAFHRDGQLFGMMTVRDSLDGFWEKVRKAGRVKYEIVVRTQTSPESIRALADFGSFIRNAPQGRVGGVIGPADYLLTTRFMLRTDDPMARTLPENVAEARLIWDYYGTAMGTRRLHQVVDANYWQSLTTVFLKDANFVDTARLMSDVRSYEREHLRSKGIKVGFAGDVAVSQSLIKGIVTTQMQSLVWSLVGIFLVTALFGRSLRWGVYCVLPSALAVLINFAVMGWFGIPLGVATSMFAGMTLGIGVDFAIHVLEGCEAARARGATLPEALSRALALTGPPVLINTVAISLGFGVLLLSQVPANARLGLLLVLGMVNCLVASLLMLPVLLHWWPMKDVEASQPSERRC